MEIRVRDLVRTPLGSASFVDLRLPDHSPFMGQSVLPDTLAIHVRPRVLRRPAHPQEIQARACRRRLHGRPHVGMLHVRRAGELYVAYINPADEELPERVQRIRERGCHWLCMYDLLGTFGLTEIGPLDPDFMGAILEVREEAKRVSLQGFERAVDEVDWTLKHPEFPGLRLPEGLEDFKGAVCTARTPRAPSEFATH